MYWKNKTTQYPTEEVIMFKHLPATVLALGVMCAVPAAAQTVQGGHLYIQDFDAPVQITYLPSYATHETVLFVGMLDANGNLVGSFERLLINVGSKDDTASLGTCYGCLITGNGKTSYTFTPVEGAVELVFFWNNRTAGTSYYSSVYPGKTNPVDSSGNKWDSMTYGANNTATVGFEDGGGAGTGGNLTDWDRNDINISLTNVGSARPQPPLPAVPEPESWAMMLAGFGMVGSVVRRRRNRIQ
jgi:hypothetical protein